MHTLGLRTSIDFCIRPAHVPMHYLCSEYLFYYISHIRQALTLVQFVTYTDELEVDEETNKLLKEYDIDSSPLSEFNLFSNHVCACNFKLFVEVCTLSARC